MKDSFINRKYVIITLILVAVLGLIVRLFIIQVVMKSYRLSAENNVLRYITQYPARGLIYDRNGKLVVYNQAAYDLMVIPAQTARMDTVAFCNLLGISREVFMKQMKNAITYTRRAPSIFLKQISDETYARFQEKMFMYPGFYTQPRTLRKYARPVAAHLLGYVSEADESVIRKNPYYKSGDYIGKSGIEEAYETDLRGRRGVKIYQVDVYTKIKGAYSNGKMDTLAVQGSDITSSIDLDLQEYGEKLMQNKRGSIVAIEPQTGEILTLVSAPSYDPSLLVGRIRSENFSKLMADSALKPLFNRALMASYPPGSTFKPINGLIGLQEGVINRGTLFECHNGYMAGKKLIACHVHASPLNIIYAIGTSCNAYFCQEFKRVLENPRYNNVKEAYDKWKSYLNQFGFGSKLGTDFVNELSGFIPSSDYFDKYYGKNRWRALTVVSMAIGQGEVGITPLQMANMTAAIANRGYYFTPHIVKGVGPNHTIDDRFLKKHTIDIDPENFEIVIDGMESAVKSGSAMVATIKGITICGKTGTAQNPHGNNHSVFIAFAPREDPKIAIAVYVENAGYGATYAAPVASLMIEKYLKGEISNTTLEQRILNMNLDKSVGEEEH